MARSSTISRPFSSPRWVFELYVVGATVMSLRAIANLEKICREHLAGDFRIEMIDLDVRPKLAVENNITAIPTLIRRSPEPALRVIGDLSDTDVVLDGLQIIPN